MAFSRRNFSQIFCFPVIIFFIICFSCKNQPKPLNWDDNTPDTLALVKTNCGHCHAVPDPSSLDIKTWDKTVLKNMGCRLGIQTPGYDPFSKNNMMDQSLLLNANIYPSQPLVSEINWEKIRMYYLGHASTDMEIPTDSSLDLDQFRIWAKGDMIEMPRVTMLYFDSLNTEIKVGIETGKIYSFTKDWTIHDSMNIGSTPIQYKSGRDTSYILSVGVLYPSEQKTGSLIQKVGSNLVTVLSDLHRPVWMTFIDINEDHQSDYLISEFGYETGQLNWYDPKTKSRNTGHSVYKGPGTIKTLLVDLDFDGKKEVVGLFAQGNEHVSAYLIEDGKLMEKTLLSFPAVYGVCDIDVEDFNGDHLPDLIISNGDNADYTQVTKPFHGIHIFINKGHFVFEESKFIFYPGILHSEIADYDQDGDLDVAAVSFFPGDINNPYPSFKYFEQTDSNNFIGRTFKNANYGKWMNLLKADVDVDGDLDLVLGSFLLNTQMINGTREEIKSHGLLFLENKLISKRPF